MGVTAGLFVPREAAMPMFRLKSTTVEARQFLARDGASAAMDLAAWCGGKPLYNSTPFRTIEFLDKDGIICFLEDGDWVVQYDGFFNLTNRQFLSRYELVQ